MWYYEWLGYGLVIYSPDGKEIFLQGDEASQLHDELEACSSSDEFQNRLSEYSVLLED